jgi:hypothetical protein
MGLLQEPEDLFFLLNTLALILRHLGAFLTDVKAMAFTGKCLVGPGTAADSTEMSHNHPSIIYRSPKLLAFFIFLSFDMSGPVAEGGDGLGKNSSDGPTNLILFGGMDLQGVPNVYIHLQAQPKFNGIIKEAGQTKGGIRRNRPFAADDFADPHSGYSQSISQLLLG